MSDVRAAARDRPPVAPARAGPPPASSAGDLSPARAPRTRNRLRLLPSAALALALVSAVGLLASVAALPAHRAEDLNSPVAMALLTVGMVGLAAAGGVLARQQPRSVIAWLMLSTALAWMVSGLALTAAVWLLEVESPVAPAAGWLTNWVWVPAHALSMVMLLRFPTGRLPGRRWRPAEWTVLTWATVVVLTTALLPGPLGAEALTPLTNPLGLAVLDAVAAGLLSALFLVLPVLLLVAAAAPVVRWRRTGTRERAALRWIALAAGALAVSAPLALVAEAGEVLQGLAFLLLPLAIGTAVLREQLWDLDLRRRYDRLRAARVQERERLRHELHDSLGPLLGSITMRAEAARNLLAAGDTSRIDGLLQSIGTATEGALDEVRRLLDDLGPAALQDRDLVPALQEQLAAYADVFPVTLDAQSLPPLEERAASTAYLVVVEAVRNAARHSGGHAASVSLRLVGDTLEGEVRDDGRGVGEDPAGVGRTAMARRIQQEGGRLVVTDHPDGGALVRFELPGVVR